MSTTHPLSLICPVEHDPERNKLQKAVLDAALNYFLIDQRCCAFFDEAKGLTSGVYVDPGAKALELEAKSQAARDRLMQRCADLLKLTSRKKSVRGDL